MSATIALEAALGRLGWSSTGQSMTVEEQQIDSVEELSLLTDDCVENLCKVIRRPWRTMKNPNAGQDGQAARIPSTGTQISQRAEGNMQLTCYYLRHQIKISRKVDAAGITLEAVRGLRDMRDSELPYKDPTVPPIINENHWPKTTENIAGYLGSYMG